MKHAREDYNRIQDPAGLIPMEEPVFLLRGQDKYAAETLRYYAALVGEGSLSEKDYARTKPIIDATMAHAELMDAWPKKKVPDMPANAPANAPADNNTATADPTFVSVYSLPYGGRMQRVTNYPTLVGVIEQFVHEQSVSLKSDSTPERRIALTASGVAYVSGLLASRLIYDYQVVCDDSNNSETSLGYDLYVRMNRESGAFVVKYREDV